MIITTVWPHAEKLKRRTIHTPAQVPRMKIYIGMAPKTPQKNLKVVIIISTPGAIVDVRSVHQISNTLLIKCDLTNTETAICLISGLKGVFLESLTTQQRMPMTGTIRGFYGITFSGEF